MKSILFLSIVLASGVATAQQFDMRKAPEAEPCATALAKDIKRSDTADTVLITYTVNGAKCSVVLSKADAAPDAAELGRLKTIAGHSRVPAK